jgi:hypothetical protein
MKKALYLVLIFAWCSHAFAQKCDYAKNEKDKFSGKQVVITRTDLFKEFSKRAEISFGFEDDTLVVAIGYAEVSPQPLECDNAAELWLSLSDGTIMKLKVLQAYKGRLRGSLGGTTESVFQPQYLITKEQMTRLSNSAIASFRMAHSSGAVQKDVSEKNQKKIQASAKCLLQGI